jgi:hypothetical protein
MRATDIHIESPCGADWQSMKPGDRKRFCDACKKHVHDLSAMSKDEAREVLSSPPTEGLCVRYLYDAHGDVVFRDTPMPASFLSRAKRFAALTLPMGLAACSGAMADTPPPPVPMMGAVACPMPDPPPAPTGSAIAPTPPTPSASADPRFARPPR